MDLFLFDSDNIFRFGKVGKMASDSMDNEKLNERAERFGNV